MFSNAFPIGRISFQYSSLLKTNKIIHQCVSVQGLHALDNAVSYVRKWSVQLRPRQRGRWENSSLILLCSPAELEGRKKKASPFLMQRSRLTARYLDPCSGVWEQISIFISPIYIYLYMLSLQGGGRDTKHSPLPNCWLSKLLVSDTRDALVGGNTLLFLF